MAGRPLCRPQNFRDCSRPAQLGCFRKWTRRQSAVATHLRKDLLCRTGLVLRLGSFLNRGLPPAALLHIPALVASASHSSSHSAIFLGIEGSQENAECWIPIPSRRPNCLIFRRSELSDLSTTRCRNRFIIYSCAATYDWNNYGINRALPINIIIYTKHY